MQGNPTFLTGPTGLALLATATPAAARTAIGSPAFAGDGTATVTTNSIIRSQVDSSGNVSSTIPGGSTLLPEFKCRAWVNFVGTGTVAIRASGNVSSITDNGTGQYTVNFSTAMPDIDYAAVAASWVTVPDLIPTTALVVSNTTSSILVYVARLDTSALADSNVVHVAIFR